jgi:hypothetical protein
MGLRHELGSQEFRLLYNLSRHLAFHQPVYRKCQGQFRVSFPEIALESLSVYLIGAGVLAQPRRTGVAAAPGWRLYKAVHRREKRV